MSGITHKKVVTGADDPAFQVSKDAWNDGHDIANGSIEMAMLIHGHSRPHQRRIAEKRGHDDWEFDTQF